MSAEKFQFRSSSGQPKKRRKHANGPANRPAHYKPKQIQRYSISYERYTKTVAMLNSDSNNYDYTPLAPSFKNHKDQHIRQITFRSNRNCERRIQIFEGYAPDEERLDLYQLNAPTRILYAMHVCLQSEDWKTMCELILAAIRNSKAPLMMYRPMFIQLAMIAIIHDPLARLELAEIYLTGVLNCKSSNEIDVFMQSIRQNRMKLVLRKQFYVYRDLKANNSESEIDTRTDDEKTEEDFDTNGEWETDDEENEIKSEERNVTDEESD